MCCVASLLVTTQIFRSSDNKLHEKMLLFARRSKSVGSNDLDEYQWRSMVFNCKNVADT